MAMKFLLISGLFLLQAGEVRALGFFKDILCGKSSFLDRLLRCDDTMPLPTQNPSASSTMTPTSSPTSSPSFSPTSSPSLSPKSSPSLSPTSSPSLSPTSSPIFSMSPTQTRKLYIFLETTILPDSCSSTIGNITRSTVNGNITVVVTGYDSILFGGVIGGPNFTIADGQDSVGIVYRAQGSGNYTIMVAASGYTGDSVFVQVLDGETC